MRQSVADENVVRLEDAVVGARLSERRCGDGDGGRFIFYDYPRASSLPMIEHGVAAPRHAADHHRHFVGKQPMRIVLVGDKKVREMLAHPLLGREADVAAAQKVKHRGLRAGGLRFERDGRKIEWGHVKKEKK